MRIGVLADVHGNELALRAVLEDASGLRIDRWWALGDLVLFGPRPVEVCELLVGLPGIAFVRGNTDRYVVTDEQPEPHADPLAAPRDPGLVERYGLMALVVDADLRGVTTQHRTAAFDVEAVCDDLRRRRHPNGQFVESVLKRQHPFAH